MIISASRRTDIPAFYGDWFMGRVREGFFHRVNPFNSKQVSGFSLKPEDVTAICFWTKNPRPFLRHLHDLNSSGYRYYFQFTLNPYGSDFEPHVPPLDERVATFRELSEALGPERVIWRLDPIILSDVTPAAWHLEQAEGLIRSLSSSARRLVFSFLDFYGKVEKRLGALEKKSGITLKDITRPEYGEELQALVRGLGKMAMQGGMEIYSCAEKVELSECGVKHGACIDGDLIRSLFGGDGAFAKDKNQRGACNCVASVDMGIYNTCFFKCAYCYANMHDGMIEANRARHFNDSPSLLGRHT